MFILPNRFLYAGDFVNPQLLEEGVEIMSKMLRPAIEGKAKFKKSGFVNEIDTFDAVQFVRERYQFNNCDLGTPTMTDEDHLAVIERLKKEEIIRKTSREIEATTSLIK